MEDAPAPIAVLDPPTSRHRAERWSLVLASQSVPHALHRVEGGWVIVVPPEDAARASRALSAYEDENREPPGTGATSDVPEPYGRTWVGVLTSAGLVVFFGAVGGTVRRSDWFRAGTGDAAAILDGQWWRATTALTLHADIGHILANAVSGGLFLTWLGREIGPGLALAMTVLAGTVGNLANTWLRGAPHAGVGASTGVFAVIGILAGIRALRIALQREEGGIGGWGLPLAAGVAMLALMGSSEQSDVLAHLTGLLAGMVIGLPLGLMRTLPGRNAQWGLAAASVAAVALAWMMALSSPI